MENTITIIGYVGRDPVLKVGNTQDFVNLPVAFTPRRRNGDGWIDDETQWYRVKCFGNLAKNVAVSVCKGQEVIVTGKLRIRTWIDDNSTERMDLELIAEGIGPNLRRGASQFRRVEHVRQQLVAAGEDGTSEEEDPFAAQLCKAG